MINKTDITQSYVNVLPEVAGHQWEVSFRENSVLGGTEIVMYLWKTSKKFLFFEGPRCIVGQVFLQDPVDKQSVSDDLRKYANEIVGVLEQLPSPAPAGAHFSVSPIYKTLWLNSRANGFWRSMSLPYESNSVLLTGQKLIGKWNGTDTDHKVDKFR